MFFRLILVLLAIFLLLAGVLLPFSTKAQMASFAAAYLSSAIVILASFKNYANMVKSRLASGMYDIGSQDAIDKIDDPFNLYDEENGILTQINENKSIKDIIKEEKKLLKQNRRGFLNSFKDTARAFNPIRLLAYGVFVLIFLLLLKSGNLDKLYYIPTLFLPNLIAIFYFVNYQKRL